MNRNDEAWNELFEQYDILNEIDRYGVFEITAKQIKAVREPRLMTKFDHTSNLPKLFADNKLSILPISRGNYIISHFNTYHDFEPDNSSIIQASLPSNIQSLDYREIKSETLALNCAIASGIIADFTKDENLIPTVSGRMSSGKFDFYIENINTNKKQHINVINSQIEIDAAYEGLKYLTLFEAKNDLSDDFLVRQLYYPYRTWGNKITKDIKTIFLIYSNGIYRMYEYAFETPYEYNSLALVKQQKYSIEDTRINICDIQSIVNNVKIVDDPQIPFPQANRFERIINLCELLNNQDMDRNSVTENYDFDVRQTNYYTDAARYLGLLEKNRRNEMLVYSLSPLGKRILKMDYKQRQLAFCKQILSHKIFKDVLQLYLLRGKLPERNDIVWLMKQTNLYNIQSDETYFRRASTIKSWMEWIVGLVNE